LTVMASSTLSPVTESKPAVREKLALIDMGVSFQKVFRPRRCALALKSVPLGGLARCRSGLAYQED
jgi:hypothetical protein